MVTPNIAILDSSALVALVNVADQLHAQATPVDELTSRDDWLVLLPREVFAETLNALGKKASRGDAALAGRAIIGRHAAGDFEFIHGQQSAYTEAFRLLAAGRGGPSFIDFLVMALADAYQTPYIFGFDATFRKNGYLLPGEAAKGRAA